MTSETAVIFFISLVLLWVKPGPGQALRLTYALQYGFWSAFLIALGVLTICLGYFVFVALGYSALSSSSLPFVFVLKILGALYLLYLGIIGFKNNNKKKEENKKTAMQKHGWAKHYMLGVFMALSNPVTIFYFVGILPTLVPMGELSTQDILAGLVLIAFAGILVDGLFILLTVFAKESFSGRYVFKYLSLVTSACFVLIGLFLLYSAIFMPHGLSFDIL